jgi:DNA-binding XRE family transcriptional regulator
VTNTLINNNIQIIHDQGGKPAFVVIPYADYINLQKGEDLIPHSVISNMVDGATAIRAWREHLGLTQEEMATRLNISQSAYAQQESVNKPRKITRQKIAQAMGIQPELLDL